MPASCFHDSSCFKTCTTTFSSSCRLCRAYSHMKWWEIIQHWSPHFSKRHVIFNLKLCLVWVQTRTILSVFGTLSLRVPVGSITSGHAQHCISAGVLMSLRWNSTISRMHNLSKSFNMSLFSRYCPTILPLKCHFNASFLPWAAYH